MALTQQETMENKYERPKRSMTDQVNPIKFSFKINNIEVVSGRVIDLSNNGTCGLMTVRHSAPKLREEGTLVFCKGGGEMLELAAEVRWIDGSFIGFQTAVNMKTTVMRNYLG